MRKAIAIGLALGLIGATAASAFSARNGYRVSGTAEGFEVFGPSGGSALFCAAGDFARSRLGARATDRVFLVRGVGPSPTIPGQRSALFVLTGPEQKTPWGGGAVILPFQGAGQNRSVGHAAFLCENEK